MLWLTVSCHLSPSIASAPIVFTLAGFPCENGAALAKTAAGRYEAPESSLAGPDASHQQIAQSDMPNETVRRLTREAFALEVRERDAALGQQRAELQTDAARRGASRSGANARRIADLYRAEVKIRCMILFQAYARVAASYPIPEGHGPLEEAAEFLVPILRENTVHLDNALQSIFTTIGFGYGQTLNDAFEEAQRRLLLDAELLEARMSKRPEGEGARITITGNQNIVQAASPGAFASMTLDNAGKAQITEALKLVREAVSALSADAMPAKNELLSTVGEAEAELAKPAPNKVKLPALLGGIGGTIQTVAALKPAYDALKGALAYVGVFI